MCTCKTKYQVYRVRDTRAAYIDTENEIECNPYVVKILNATFFSVYRRRLQFYLLTHLHSSMFPIR